MKFARGTISKVVARSLRRQIRAPYLLECDIGTIDGPEHVQFIIAGRHLTFFEEMAHQNRAPWVWEQIMALHRNGHEKGLPY